MPDGARAHKGRPPYCFCAAAGAFCPTVTQRPPSCDSENAQPTCEITFSKPQSSSAAWNSSSSRSGSAPMSALRIGAQILDAGSREPPLHLADRVPVLLRVDVLIAEPRLAPLRLRVARAEHRIEGDVLEPGHAAHGAAQAVREACVAVVEAEHDDAAGLGELGDAGEGRARIRRVVQHAGRVDDVEGALREARRSEVRLHEAHAVHVVAARRVGAELEGGAREVCAHDDAIGGGEEQRHLPRAAAHLDDSRVAGDGALEEPRELAARRAAAQARERVVGRIVGEGRFRVELTDRVRAHVRVLAQIDDAVLDAVRLIARVAAQRRGAPLAVEAASARGAGQELEEALLGDAFHRLRGWLRRWHR